jgi:YD repeat-containing protein
VLSGEGRVRELTCDEQGRLLVATSQRALRSASGGAWDEVCPHACSAVRSSPEGNLVVAQRFLKTSVWVRADALSMEV